MLVSTRRTCAATGLRYVSTRSPALATSSTSRGPADNFAGNKNWTPAPTHDHSSYNDFLPSVSVAFDLTKVDGAACVSLAGYDSSNFANMFGVTVSGFNDDRVEQ